MSIVLHPFTMSVTICSCHPEIPEFSPSNFLWFSFSAAAIRTEHETCVNVWVSLLYSLFFESSSSSSSSNSLFEHLARSIDHSLPLSLTLMYPVGLFRFLVLPQISHSPSGTPWAGKGLQGLDQHQPDGRRLVKIEICLPTRELSSFLSWQDSFFLQLTEKKTEIKITVLMG